MKSILIVSVVIAAVLVCAVVGCRMFSKRSTEATIKLEANPAGKIAIVYFSQSQVQNTALVAKWIQKHVGGDLIAIEPTEPYPEPYFRTLATATLERKSGKKRPIKPTPSLAAYDVVFLGTPIWYGTYAFPVELFLKANPLIGKTVAPFSTHGGGGAPFYERDVKAACPAAKVLPGFTARGSNQIERRLGTGVTAHHTEDDVVRWLNGIFGE